MDSSLPDPATGGMTVDGDRSRAVAGRRGARERIIDAATDLAGGRGFARLTTEAVLAEAAVSRATFYQYFASIEDCLGAVYRIHAGAFVARWRSAVLASDRPELTAAGALFELARAEPRIAEMLVLEGMALRAGEGCPRDALIAALTELVASAGTQAVRLDLPVPMFLGAAMRLIGLYLTRGGVPPVLFDELRLSTAAFERPAAEHGWSDRLAVPAGERVRRPAPVVKLAAPARERIIHATAAAVTAKGYRETTVGEILAGGRVSRGSFYANFDGKPEAFAAAYEYGFRALLSECAPAFFEVDAWPERVWRAGLSFSRWLAREPCLAYLGAVECYAPGREAVARVHATQLAWTIFLEEGYHDPERPPPPRRCSEVIAMLLMELGYRTCRARAPVSVRALAPGAAYLVLAPFLGAEAAGRFVTKKLNAPRHPQA